MEARQDPGMLDHALFNGDWSLLHLGAVLQHLGYIRSDHRPLLLDTDYNQVTETGGSGPRRFEAKWFKEKYFCEEVQRAWDAVNALLGVGMLGKINLMHVVFLEWDWRVLQKLKRHLRAHRELKRAMNGPLNVENKEKTKAMVNLIELLLEQDEIYWAKCSRANWIQIGDRNNPFSHQFASAQWKKNRIKKLMADDNNWVEGTEQQKPIVLNYFANLFTSEVQDINSKVLEKIQLRLTQTRNEKLLAPFSE
jgi:hypothetical protein